MVQVITREWEIAKTYIYEVALRDGMIRLDWNDFEMKAWKSKPAVAVKVDEPLGISEMSVKAIDEIKKNINNTLSSVIIIISYKKDQPLMMDELGGMNECLSRLAERHFYQTLSLLCHNLNMLFYAKVHFLDDLSKWHNRRMKWYK